jgi:hypothetical protein
MLLPGQGVWIRMLVIVAIAYGGSFAKRCVTSALTDMVAALQGVERPATQTALK